MKKSIKGGTKPLSIALSCAILVQFTCLPAIAQAIPTESQPIPTELNLVVVEGEGAINNVRQRLGREPIVQVEDENHKPIAGAAVVFTLPTEGVTGEFLKGQKTLMIMTDSQGRAAAKGFKINQVPGTLQIHVTASYKGLTARTNIVQIVEGPPIHGTKGVGHSSSGKWIALLAVVGGAAAGGVVYATSRKSPAAVTVVTPPPPTVIPIGITPGTGTIAPPH